MNVIDTNNPIADAPPEEVSRDKRVIESYLGEEFLLASS